MPPPPFGVVSGNSFILERTGVPLIPSSSSLGWIVECEWPILSSLLCNLYFYHNNQMKPCFDQSSIMEFLIVHQSSFLWTTNQLCCLSLAYKLHKQWTHTHTHKYKKLKDSFIVFSNVLVLQWWDCSKVTQAVAKHRRMMWRLEAKDKTVFARDRTGDLLCVRQMW